MLRLTTMAMDSEGYAKREASDFQDRVDLLMYISMYWTLP